MDRNKVLDNIPSEYTLSIVIRNFMLNASIIKPRTTFIELSQPPDFGIRLIIDGNNANIVNGSAKAIPNPSIPIVGLRTSPLAASTRSAPIMGPVQEKETITVVKSHKKCSQYTTFVYS